MLIAFCFCNIGENLLVYIATMNKIPSDLFEAVFIDMQPRAKYFFR